MKIFKTILGTEVIVIALNDKTKLCTVLDKTQHEFTLPAERLKASLSEIRKAVREINKVQEEELKTIVKALMLKDNLKLKNGIREGANANSNEQVQLSTGSGERVQSPTPTPGYFFIPSNTISGLTYYTSTDSGILGSTSD